MAVGAGILGGTALIGAISSSKQSDRADTAARDAAAIQGQSIDRAGELTEAGIQRGLGFLEPFSGVGLQGVEQAGFLTDPDAQFEFLQSNPLFQLALDNANRVTEQNAAARSRLSAGDTLQRLSENVLLSASPLIAGQKNSILDLLGIGTGVATAQANTSIGGATNLANLATNRGDVGAAGRIGSANAQNLGTQGVSNSLNNALLAGLVFGKSGLSGGGV